MGDTPGPRGGSVGRGDRANPQAPTRPLAFPDAVADCRPVFPPSLGARLTHHFDNLRDGDRCAERIRYRFPPVRVFVCQFEFEFSKV